MPDSLWSHSPLTLQAEAQRLAHDKRLARQTRAEHRRIHRDWVRNHKSDRATRIALNHRQGGPFEASFPPSPGAESIYPGPNSSLGHDPSHDPGSNPSSGSSIAPDRLGLW